MVTFFFFECQKCQSNISSQVFHRAKNGTRATVTKFCRTPNIFVSFFLQFTVWLLIIPNISKALGTLVQKQSSLFQSIGISIKKGNWRNKRNPWSTCKLDNFQYIYPILFKLLTLNKTFDYYQYSFQLDHGQTYISIILHLSWFYYF